MEEQTQEGCVKEQENLTCKSVTSQYADVSVPLRLKPYAIVGKLVVECCGEPVVMQRPCQGGNSSCGCDITIMQTLCIKVPLEYGANADIGDTVTNCKRNNNSR